MDSDEAALLAAGYLEAVGAPYVFRFREQGGHIVDVWVERVYPEAEDEQ